ncbi:MAG: TldD/PmbA family protein [Bacteroidales bacterium]|nr:TldD/PmbA family protein [Bacteroidales bacterium]
MRTDKIDNKFEVESAQMALDMVMKQGAQACRITMNFGIQNSFSALDGKLENLQNANDRNLYIQIISNGRYGAYSTNRLNKEELEKFISQAMHTTSYLTPDECRTLPPKEICWFGNEDALEQYDPYIMEMPPQRKKEIAFEVMEEIYGKNKKIVSVNTEYGDMLEYQYMIDSQGFEGDSLQSNFTVSAECSVKGRGNARSEGWWYESALHYNKFNPAGCGTKALKRALDKLNPKDMEGGCMNMIVDNTCSSRVISPIFQALNGSNIQQQNSFLLNKKGEKVFSEKFTLKDNPHWRGMSGSRYFDGDGIATRPMDIIRNGVVQTYFINTYSANKMGCTPTVESASVPHFSLDEFPEDMRNLTHTEMMKIMDKGILVTGFNGGNCNGLTGDFSYGIEGFYFEGGEILFPVREMNISGNIVSLWRNLAMVGNDARTCSRWLIPSLAFENVEFTGI